VRYDPREGLRVLSASGDTVTSTPISITFAGGGSGGHLSPGLAIDERLREIADAADARSIFLCSNRAIDATMLGEAGVKFVALPATPPSVRPKAALRFLRTFRASVRQAREIMLREKVTQVVALGGFVAAPVVKAAKSLGIPVLLVNLDAPPGKANRWMAKRCDEVISAIDLPMLPGFASQVVGMPIRRRALAPAPPEECRLRLSLDPHAPVLLITGASQGATSINALMLQLAHTQPALFQGWQILHLGGHGADDPIRAAYRQAGIQAQVLPFLNDIGLAWGAADLAISRAGANSVAEIAHNAVPAIFLPYPYHKDTHQRHNAQPLIDLPGGGGVGGAVMEIDRIDAAANARHIAPILGALLRDSDRRQRMRDALRQNPWPDAAMTIARMLINRSSGSSG
jgi:UDP-N-acetylglucosamine--N-acetylmuramyl-(pentapeptide) pyrophosphoryl-undecaprenol N-acetylglucosamine transferase